MSCVRSAFGGPSGWSVASPRERPRLGAALPRRLFHSSRSGRRRRPGTPSTVSNESGIWQVHAFDTETGVTPPGDGPSGRRSSTPLPRSTARACSGSRTRPATSPAAGTCSRSTAATPTPFLDGVPHGWNEGFTQAPGIVVAAISRPRRLRGLRLARRRPGATDRPPLAGSRSASAAPTEDGFLRGALSADGSLLCLEHAEHGDLIHPALRVARPAHGQTPSASSSTTACR